MSFNKGDKVRFIAPCIDFNVQIGDTGVIDRKINLYGYSYGIKLDKNEETVPADSTHIESISKDKNLNTLNCECGQKNIEWAKHSDYCPLYVF
jgi:hypothetical protein